MTIEEIIGKFKKEFAPVEDKFEIIRLLKGKGELSDKSIRELDPPYVWHPGVYLFYGNGSPYRVGRHLTNSRLRVLQHLESRTENKDTGANVWDIANAPDREILLFNVIDINDYHWVAALEIFMENALKKDLKIPAKREG